SLVFSLVEGAFILPTHVAHSDALTREGSEKGPIRRTFDNFMEWMRNRIYAPALDFSLRNKAVTLAGLTALLLMTVGAFQGGIIRNTFFPNIEFDFTQVQIKLPAGTNERITESWLNKIEQDMFELNETLSEEYFGNDQQLFLKIQRTLGPSTYEGRIDMTILDSESRGDTIEVSSINQRIREKIGPIPDADFFAVGGLGAFGKPVSLTLLGPNLAELTKATEALKDSLRNLQELTDVADDNQEGLREINIQLNEKGLFLGLNLQDVISQVRQGFFGSEIQRLQRGRDEVRVWVRYDRSERSSIEQLENMRIRFTDGREFPLGEIADFDVERGVISISHIEGKRGITIDAALANTAASSSEINSNIQEVILPQILQRYPTVSSSVEGEARENNKSFASMAIVFPIALLLMFFVIALTFKSVGQTMVVASLIPFAMIGVGWGHYFMGYPISLPSALGVFALIGVLINDTLVFVTTYNQMLQSGMSQREAVRESGLARFRPIVLTSVTTIAGLTPLMFFEKSVQAQFLIPMAISVAWGLLVITVIILLLLPVLLTVTNRIRVYSLYAWEGEKPDLEMVEPAISDRRSNYVVWLIGALLMAAVFAAAIALMFFLTGKLM
ncbi:MAG: efflux RND transporter permease subunit, partial [Bacteroidota bacterium]